MQENIKPVVGYEHRYLVDSEGGVYSHIDGNLRKLTPTLCKDGYLRVGLYAKDKSRKMIAVHRIVASTFIGCDDDNLVVNHLNGIKSDNRLVNLEWVTRRDNLVHALNMGLLRFPTSRKDISAEATKMRAEGKTLREIAEYFSVSTGTAYKWANYHNRNVAL